MHTPLYHRITQKILVIGPSGCGKTSLIESILSRTNCQFKHYRQSSKIENGISNNFKQHFYSQTVHFQEIEIILKIFERTCNGRLDRSTIQPYYHELDAIIAVYDWTNYRQSFQQMCDALDSVLDLYNDDDNDGKSSQQPRRRPTVFVLGNIRDHRRCRTCCPSAEAINYFKRIAAIQLNYCYSSPHIKAFHYLIMLNIYRQHFRQQQSTVPFEKAIMNCRKHVYHFNHGSSSSSLLKNLFKRIKIASI